jgi:four helix bundle protein
VWQEAHKLALIIYRITKEFPKAETYGLTGQMRRAAVSISSNIAEGFGRRTSKDKNSFYTNSLTSLTELQNQLIISKDIEYIEKENFLKIAEQTVTVHKLINGLIKSTRIRKYEP